MRAFLLAAATFGSVAAGWTAQYPPTSNSQLKALVSECFSSSGVRYFTPTGCLSNTCSCQPGGTPAGRSCKLRAWTGECPADCTTTEDADGWSCCWKIPSGNGYYYAPLAHCNAGANTWDVSAVDNFNSVWFLKASFNEDISSWDVSRATTMTQIFSGALAFNQPLSAWGPKLGKVTKFNSAFEDAATFDQDLSSWNVSGVATGGLLNHASGSFYASRLPEAPLSCERRRCPFVPRGLTEPRRPLFSFARRPISHHTGQWLSADVSRRDEV